VTGRNSFHDHAHCHFAEFLLFVEFSFLLQVYCVKQYLQKPVTGSQIYNVGDSAGA